MTPPPAFRPGWLRILVSLLLVAPTLAACAAAPPAPRCRSTIVDALSLRFVRGNPVVTAAVNGTLVNMLLDTGAETSAITQAAAARLHLLAERDGRTTVTGMDGTHAQDVVRANVALTGAGRVLVMPMIDLPGDLDELSGVAGVDILSDWDLDLDQPGGQVTLRRAAWCTGDDPPWPDPPWPGRSLPLPAAFTTRKRILVTVGVFTGSGGQVDVQALLDTGSAGSVLSRAAARRAGLTDEGLAAGTPFVFYGAAMLPLNVSVVQLDHLQIGRDRVPNPQVAVPPAELPGVSMLLGNDYLARRRILISWARKTVFVQNGR